MARSLVASSLLTLFITACAASPTKSQGGDKPVPDDALAMSVRQVVPVPAGVAVVGRVMHGVARAPADAELLGFGDPIKVRIAALDRGGQAVTEIAAGEDAAALLQGVTFDAIRVGQVLATPGAYHASTKYTADFTLTKDEENPERNTPTYTPYGVTIGGVKGTFHSAHDGDLLEYGVATRGTLVLEQSIVLLPFTSTIMWGGAIVGDMAIIAPAR